MALPIRIPPKEVAGVLLASLAAAALIVVAMAVLGEYTKTRGRLLLTAISLSGFCLLALAPSALSARPRRSLLGGAGLAAAGLGYLLLVIGTWTTPDSDAYWKSAGVVWVGAVFLSYACLLLLLEPEIWPARIAPWVAAGASGLVPALAAIAIIAEIKAAPFWWAVVIIIIVQVAWGVALLAFSRRPRQQVRCSESWGEGE